MASVVLASTGKVIRTSRCKAPTPAPVAADVSCRWTTRPRAVAPSGRPVTDETDAEPRPTFVVSVSTPAGTSILAPARGSEAPVTVSTPPAGPIVVAERVESTKAEVWSVTTPLPIVTGVVTGGGGSTEAGGGVDVLSPPPQAARMMPTRTVSTGRAMVAAVGMVMSSGP